MKRTPFLYRLAARALVFAFVVDPIAISQRTLASVSPAKGPDLPLAWAIPASFQDPIAPIASERPAPPAQAIVPVTPRTTSPVRETSTAAETTAPTGATTPIASANGGGGSSSSCEYKLTHNQSPVVSLSKTQLWPVNHSLVDVGYGVNVTSACEDRVTTKLAVYSDEPDEDQTGDGNFPGDAKFDHGDLFLRAERKGNSDGRVYLVLTTATLPGGVSGVSCDAVVVPKSQSKRDIAAVKAQADTAVNYCEAHAAAPASYVKLTEAILAQANAAPVVNAGPDQAIDFPGSATLNGTVTDDGRPHHTLCVSWSKVSGPGTVTFHPAGAAHTTATFSAPGTYVLRLTANDSQLSSSDDVTVVVSVANNRPTVNAGPDQDLTLPTSTATLAGTASDDGRPAPLVVTWSVVSPVGALVTFGNVHAVSTTATFPGVGTYVLRLTADDTQLQASDDMSVTVHEQAVPVVAIADASVPEGQEGTTAAALNVTLSRSWPQAVTIDYMTADGTATAGCDYRPTFGTLRFEPGQTALQILVPVAGELLPEANETVILRVGNVTGGATLDQDHATLTILNDDAPNAPPSAITGRTPADRSTGIAMPPTLAWSATDPDAGDVLTHDVHLGTSFSVSGQSWARSCAPIQGPGPRSAAVTGYDEENDRLIVFGGTGSIDESVWVLSNATAAGGAPAWASFGTVGGPVGLARAAAAYDAATNRLFVFGGCAGDCATGSDETWVLSHANAIGGTPTWSLLAGTGPSARVDHSLAIDAAGRSLLLFGGAQGAEGGALDDVWRLSNLDGVPAWEPLATTGAGPGARAGMTASYDSEQNLLLVFGGRVGTSVLADTWVLRHANGTGGPATWSEVETSDTTPPARWGHAAAYDPVSGRLVVFGGSTAVPNPAFRFLFSDTWMLKDAAGAAPEWVRLTVGGGPTGRVQASSAYSASANRLLVFGGTATTAGATEELWTLADTIGTLPLVSSDTAPSLVPDGLVNGAQYYWRVVARDNHGAWRGSTAWRFTSNRPPLVEAGPDQEIRFPVASVSLSGTATDDGLPAPSAFVTTWTSSGPAAVGFADPASVATTATFTVAGTYVLTLTATDGIFAVSDTLTVVVRNANEPPLVNAGPNQTLDLPGSPNDAAPFIQLVKIQTGFSSPIGIDYHQPTNKMVMSVNYPLGQPYNFELVAADGSRQRFGNISGLREELKIAVVPDEGGGFNRGGFPAGTLFSGTGAAGAVLRVSPDGSVVDNPWIVLPGEAGLLRGSLHVDRTGVFGGDLIVVTTEGGVWRVKATGAATKLAQIPTHLEGLNTIPDDPARYGPWAGKILIGAEQQSRLYTVDAQGAVAFFELGIAPEDIEVIPPNQNFFGSDFGGGTLWGIRASSFAGMVGDILIPQESPGILWWVRWNGVSFDVSKVAEVPQWEHVAFGPAGILDVASTSTTVTLQGTASDDGLPLGQLTSSWSRVPGHGSVSFAQPTQLATAATLSEPGTYDLQLTASDGQLESTDTMTVTVRANQAPVVNAGPDVSVGAGSPVTLSGSVTDDGLPVGGTLSSFWTKVLGPGTVTFAAPPADAALDYSPINNPSGPWTYGYQPLGGNFTPFTVSGTIAGLPAWLRLNPQPNFGHYPLVYANKVLGNFSAGSSEFLPAESLFLTPGPEGRRAVVRWTAPAAGTYLVQGLFQSMSSIRPLGTTQDVAVAVQGTELVRRNLGRTPDAAPFSFVRTLGAGEIVEFSVGWGSDFNFFFDDTILSARITPASSHPTSPTFSSPGTYLLRLTGTDGERSASDEVTVRVAPTACTPIPTAPAGWWAGEGSAENVAGGPPATLLGGVGFAPGKVGQAFVLDGVDDAVVATAAPSLNVSSFTLEGWVRPATTNRFEPIFEYTSPNTRIGVHLWHSYSQPVNGLVPGILYANVRDTSFGDHTLQSGPSVLRPGEWAHVALTYDATSGLAQLFVNGSSVATAPFAPFVPATAMNLNLGYRPANAESPTAYRFTGQLDEMTVFGRALSADEIRAIANVGAFGKCREVNQAPVVNAGPDLTAVLRCDQKAVASLLGSVTDDGLPAGSTLTSTWTSPLGPAPVQFSSASSPHTDATFTAVGDYTVRLAASDSSLVTQDIAVVHVEPFERMTGPLVSSGILPSHNGQNGPAVVSVSGLTPGQPYTIAVWGHWVAGNGALPNPITNFPLVEPASDVTVFANTSAPPYSSLDPLSIRTFIAGATTIGISIRDQAGFYFDNVGQFQYQMYEGLPGNAGLLVLAGLDKRLTLPVNSADLEGSVTEDGLPPTAGTTVQWTQVSGPAAVMFGNASSPTSHVTFPQTGTYVLRLSATNCLRTSSDDVTFDVNEPSDLVALSVDKSAMVVDPQSLAASGNLSATIRNQGAGPAVGFEVLFFEDRNGNGALDRSVDNLLGLAAAAAIAPGATATTTTVVQPFAHVRFAGNIVLALVDSNEVIPETDETNNYGSSATSCAPPGCDATRPDLVPSRISVGISDDDTLPVLVRIGNGGGSGAPSGVAVALYNGMPVAGATPIAVGHTGVALAAGSYQDFIISIPRSAPAQPLWVVADDAGGLTGAVAESDETNNALNTGILLAGVATQPVAVSAGPDQTIRLPIDTVTLLGTAAENTGSSLTVAWSAVGGPGSVTFARPASALTTAHFASSGVYTLRLTASNGVTTVSDDVTVTVNPANGNTNLPPIVDAGPDQSVSGTALTATLAGSVDDDGLPSGVLGASWSKVSGAGDVAFADAGNPTTVATFTSIGTYVLRLMATDGSLSSSDDVVITVGECTSGKLFVVSRQPGEQASTNEVFRYDVSETEPAQFDLTIVHSSFDNATSVAFTPAGSLLVVSSGVLGAGPGLITRFTDPDGLAVFNGTINSPSFDKPLLGAFRGKELFVTQRLGRNVLRFRFDSAGNAVPNGQITEGLQDFFPFPAIQQTVARGLVFTPTGDLLVALCCGVDRINHYKFDEAGNATLFEVIQGNGLSSPNSMAFSSWGELFVTNPGLPSPVNYLGNTISRFLFDAETGAAVPNGQFTANGLNGAIGLTFTPWDELFVTAISEPAQVARFTFDAAHAAVPHGFIPTPNTGSDVNFSNACPLGQGNRAPGVNAGPDQSLTLPATSAALSASVADDNRPTATLQVSWSQVVGPSAVVFADPSVKSTAVTLGAPGTYVLRITASDGELTASDDVTIVLNAVPNQPPVVSAGPDRELTLPTQTITINGSATDDGLPSGNLVISWSQLLPPSPLVTFASPGAAVTDVTFPAAGPYVLRLTVSDGQFTRTDDVNVLVNAAHINHAPQASAGPDQTIALPTNTATLTGQASDADGDTLTYRWTAINPPGIVTFGTPTALSTAVTVSDPGVYVLRLTIRDAVDQASDDMQLFVQFGTQTGPDPVVALTAPDDGARLTGPTSVVGTAQSDTLASWRLDYRLDGETDYTRFAAGTTSVVAGALGTLDPTMLLNGIYEVRLTVTDTGGRIRRVSRRIVVRDNQKIGPFSLSFVDLDVPVVGLPMQVTRTYDSRDKGKGDFGYGWRLDLSNVRVAEKEIAGLSWRGVVEPGFFPAYRLEPTSAQVVTVTMTDGKVLEFEPIISPSRQPFVPIDGATVSFRPRPGTNATLAPAGDGFVFVVGSWPGPMELYDGSTYDIFDPTDYILTLPDGRQLSINQTRGLTQVKDLNGNTLTVSPTGINHSSGVGITFTRDAQGRITRITDPNGNLMTYGYDTNGDLVSFTDGEENTTRFTYYQDQPHLLESVIDPRGIRPMRNEYYDDGRIKSHTDAFGKTILYAHDVTGRQEVVTDRNGATRLLSYDERGNVIKEIDSNGKVIDRTYDLRNNRLTETLAHDPGAVNVPKSEYTYDARDNVLTAKDPQGNTTEATYDALNHPTTVKDPRGNYMINTFDPKGNLTATRVARTLTGPALSETVYTYRTDGQVETGTVVADGQVCRTTYAYDTRANRIKETDCLNHEMQYTYDGNSKRLTQFTTRTGPSGPETLTTSYGYDRVGRLIRSTDPDGTFTRTVYDALGKQKETYDKLDRRTTYDYDDMGRLVRTTYPDLTTDESTYDPEGRRRSATDRAGRTTSYDYDLAGRPTKTTFVDGTFTENTYDAAGRVVAARDARGNTTSFTYDSAGRRASTKVPLGSGAFAETTFTYDANGNQRTVVDPNHHTTTFEYDEHNRRTKSIFPDLTFAETSYDSLGRRRSEKDQAGKTTRFEYDKVGRLVKVIDALNHETTYTYDEVGNRVSQTDANLHTTRIDYDRIGRETKRILPGGAFATKAYDAAGNAKTRTDFNGRTTTYEYDVNNRLRTRTYDVAAQPSVNFTYTATGRRQTSSETDGASPRTTTYEYDVRDRLKSLIYSDGRRLEYGYDGNGNRTTLTAKVAGLTLATSSTYDAANRLDLVTDPAGRAYDHGYDASGNRASVTFPNGIATTYQYDDLNRLRNLTTANSASGVAIQAYAFTLGPAGNRTRITEADNTVRNYTYDDLYRLTGEKVTVGPLTEYEKFFSYDNVGNRHTQLTNGAGAVGTATAPGSIAYGYDDRDRMLAETLDANPPVGSTYDENGNLTHRSADGSVFTWDLENRLVKVSRSDGTTVEQAYDADGNRLSAKLTPPTGPASVTNFLVDSSVALSQVVAETDGAGSLKAYYLRGDDLLAVLRPLAAAPATPADWQTRYVHADGIGSIRRLTDENGQVTDGYSYTAFGERLAHTGSDPQPYAFAGEPYDANVGFQYHRARWMDPRVGRFLGMDPWEGNIFDPPSLHRYRYVADNPANSRDPSGRFSLAEMGTVAAVSGLLFASFRGLTTAIAGGTRTEVLKAEGMGLLIGAGVGATIYAVIWGGVVAYIGAATGGVTFSPQIFNAFRNSYYVTLDRATTVYRYVEYAGPKVGSDKIQLTGQWWTTTLYPTASQAVQELALPLANTGQNVFSTVIPAGTRVLIGPAAPLWGRLGGALQIYTSEPMMMNYLATLP